jgi:hypothetical protein
LGLLLVPVVVMFSEGIPEEWQQNPGGYLAIWAGVSIALLVAGVGLASGQTWGRMLAIALLIVGGVTSGSLVGVTLLAAVSIGLVIEWRVLARKAS